MPDLKRPIQESVASITRPVALKVLYDAMRRANIVLPNVRVFYPGDDNPKHLPKAFLDDKYEDNRLPSDDRMEVHVEERYIEDLWSGMKPRERGEVPLWINEALEVDIYPIYAPVEMRVTIRYRAKSRVEAKRFYDQFSMKWPDREDSDLHDIHYMFAMPEAYMVILKEIYRLQELNAPYGETWDEFFLKGLRKGYREITDQTGRTTYGVYGETQNYVLGYFDVPTVTEKPEKIDDNDAYFVEFPYVIRYHKPIDVKMLYPIIVHNTVLSDKFRPRTEMKIAKQTKSYRDKQSEVMRYFQQMTPTNKYYDGFPGRQFPRFDEFIPRNIPILTRRVFTALTRISNENKVLMTFADVSKGDDGMTFPQVVLDALKKEAKWATTYRESVFHISLNRGREIWGGNKLILTPDLEVVYEGELDMRQYYHVRFSLVEDLSILTDDAKERLKDMPEVLKPIIDEILPGNEIEIKIPISKEDFDNIVDETHNQNNPNPKPYRGQRAQMLTVQHPRLTGYKQQNLTKRGFQ